MRETTTFDHHAEHAWLHFAIRLLIILLLIFLFLVFTEDALGKPKQELTPAEILKAEQRLSDLGYWTGPIDGVLDSASTHALFAFQKIEGFKRTGKLTATELEALSVATPPEPRDRTYPHIEIDLKRQVLMFVAADGRATNILPVCIGLAIFAACSTAAMTLPWLLNTCSLDPAFGSGPLATVIQDLLSILIYFAIAAAIVT